jgi:hypothetical protein
MSEVLNYYWNPEHPLKPYTTRQPANKGSIAPVNAARTAPPTPPEGKWPAWTGSAWGLIDDHRGEKGYVDGQPIEIKDYGPYPTGWSLDPPPPTAQELLDRQRFDILGVLDEIDRKSMRCVRAIETLRRALETAEPDAKEALVAKLAEEEDRLDGYEAQAEAKRAALAALTN